MGWHDSLAVRAAATGKTAAEFRRGARQKANATWLFLIVAAAVWYFVGWAWALIPAVVAAFRAFQSASARMIATRLDKASGLASLRTGEMRD